MIIYLVNSHEAIVADDGKGFVTVEPRHNGLFSLDGLAYTIRGDGSTPVPVFEKTHGAVHATFTTDGGIRFQVITPYMTRGVPVSRVDPFEGYIMARRYIYDMELKLEAISEELRAFKGSIVHDSLGFITGNVEVAGGASHSPTDGEGGSEDGESLSVTDGDTATEMGGLEDEVSLSDGDGDTSPIGGGLEDESAEPETIENQNNEEE